MAGALGFFIAAVYLYDRLSMPEGFWIARSADKRNKLPAFVRENEEQYGLLYAHMVHAWIYVFTPGIILAGIGLLLITMYATSVVLGALCVVALTGTIVYYRRVRPQLGVD